MMTMMIDKDTIFCCSFSGVAGNFGCQFHNAGYQALGLNYVYKPFSVTDIGPAVQAMKTLNIRGAGVSMPFKVEVLKYVDTMSADVEAIGAANTLVNDNGVITAHNTDWLAAQKILPPGKVYILGNGGLAKAVAYVAKNVNFITRDNWAELDSVRNAVVFNCTPVPVSPHASNVYINADVNSETGRKLAVWQAAEQFKLYTGKVLDDSFCERFHYRPEAS